MGRFGGQTVDDLRADPALRIGVVGGALVSATALVGFALAPAVEAGNPNVFEVFTEVAIGSIQFSLARYAAVLAGAPLVTALAGTLLARRRGLAGRATDAKVVGGVVIVPLLAVCALYVVAAVGYGATFASSSSSLSEALMFALTFTLWSLLFGFIALVAWLVIVAVAASAGAVGGYLAARGIDAALRARGRAIGPPAGERE